MTLPFVIQPSADEQLLPWATSHREMVHQELARHGAVLFRGFGGMTAETLESLIVALTGEPLEYTHRSTPRSRVSGKIFTSTEYPADQTIPQHNEMSYTTSWPRYLFFGCLQASETGGETPISDSRRVFERLRPELRDRFLAHGVMYVRNFHERIGLPWQEVFQTSDKAEVEAYCDSQGVKVEWTPKGRLRTIQVCQAALTHPRTNEQVWFNQAHLFHVSNLQPSARKSMQALFAPQDLPRNALYGDGTPIEDATLDEIRAAYEAESVAFPWQTGDVLMLDNIAVAHGRRPFTGPRRIVVGMSALGGAT